MRILLEDKEIQAIPVVGGPGNTDDKNIAKAQLKKLVNIIKRDCPETLFLLEDLKFWHDLLGEIE